MLRHGKPVKTSKELIGEKFNLLTIISETTKNKHGHRVVFAKCDCGNEGSFTLNHLRSGKTGSCGCRQKQAASMSNSVHGLSGHPLFKVWLSMRDRCNRQKNSAYKNYGGRGIKICKEWATNFVAFYNWAMANGYKEGLDIDRENNDGNYEPSNCRFTTRLSNCMNRRNTLYLEYMGEVKTLCEWASIFNKNRNLVSQRIHRDGWSIERALKE